MKKQTWKPAKTAPKDGTLILAHFGYPWPCITCWSNRDQKWIYATLQACKMEDGEYDYYFENEQEKELISWRTLPEIPNKTELEALME